MYLGLKILNFSLGINFEKNKYIKIKINFKMLIFIMKINMI